MDPKEQIQQLSDRLSLVEKQLEDLKEILVQKENLNKYKLWTIDEEDQLSNLIKENKTLKEISYQIQN